MSIFFPQFHRRGINTDISMDFCKLSVTSFVDFTNGKTCLLLSLLTIRCSESVGGSRFVISLDRSALYYSFYSLAPKLMRKRLTYLPGISATIF